MPVGQAAGHEHSQGACGQDVCFEGGGNCTRRPGGAQAATKTAPQEKETGRRQAPRQPAGHGGSHGTSHVLCGGTAAHGAWSHDLTKGTAGRGQEEEEERD